MANQPVSQTQQRRFHRMSRPLDRVVEGRRYKLWQLPEGMAILYRHVRENRLYRFIARSRQESIGTRELDTIHGLQDDVIVMDLGFRDPRIYGNSYR